MIKLLKVLVLILSISGVFPISKQDFSHSNTLELAETIEIDFHREFTKYVQTGIISSELDSMFDILKLPNELRYNEMSELSESDSIVTCLTCRAAVNTFINYRRKDNMTLEQLSNLANEICVRLNIQTEVVCNSMVEQMAPILIYVVDNYPEVGSYDTCAIIAQSENCGSPKHKMFELKIEIAEGAPEINGHKKALPSSGEFYKIIHIGDIHYDPNYIISGNAKCNQPTCCRFNQGPPQSPEDAAGRWGDYRDCDMPLETIQNAFRTIKQLHGDADQIYFSGDIIDHGVWETTTNGNILKIETIIQLMKTELQNIPIYPTLGNHEAHPVNIYAPPHVTDESLSIQWLYDYIASAWSQWLPKESLDTVKKGGYYTTLIAPRYRLIVLNNNDCYTYNFWILSGVDPLKEQLQWLHDTLLLAEQNNEKVHIMRHLPLGVAGCFRSWTKEYTKIIERFSNVIAAQFDGHTHKNEFGLFYDTDNAKFAVNVGFNGGSLTTYSKLNPNFMVFYVDKESLEVFDFESFMFNLTDANSNPYETPNWYKSYSFKNYWNLTDLSPASFNGLVERLVSDDNEGYKYWEQKIKQGDLYVADGCQGKCLQSNICRIVTTDFEDERRCKALYKKKLVV